MFENFYMEGQDVIKNISLDLDITTMLDKLEMNYGNDTFLEDCPFVDDIINFFQIAVDFCEGNYTTHNKFNLTGIDAFHTLSTAFLDATTIEDIKNNALKQINIIKSIVENNHITKESVDNLISIFKAISQGIQQKQYVFYEKYNSCLY